MFTSESVDLEVRLLFSSLALDRLIQTPIDTLSF